jgi:hypothetical protein
VLDGITATDVSNWNGKKDKQTAVTFTGSTLKTPTSMTQDANGELAVTFTDIQSASTSQKGIVQLSDATNSTSTALAATANALKTAYDLAASKQGAVSTDTDSSDFSDTTTVATGFGSNKIHLNVASRLWNYIKGKLGISSSGSATKFLNEQGGWATVTTPDVSGKADKVSGATAGDVATLDANGNLVDSDMTLGTSVPANAEFTDTKVMHAKLDSGDTAYPLLMSAMTNPNGQATSVRYDSAVLLTPSTNTISANISGNAATATTATTASSATALAIPRYIHVNLGSNTGTYFDGSANITPGVMGVLPTTFGGTGYSTVDTAPTEASNKMVTSGGVWNFSAPANLGILIGVDASPENDFDRFVVLVTGSVRLPLDWLRKKSGRIIEFYNLNDYEIPINIVFKHSDEKVLLHRRGAHTLTVKSNGEGSNAQELRSLSYKGYIKLYTNYNTDTGYYEFYEISDFIHLTGSLTTSMIGNAGTSGTTDTRTGMIYHNDIVCNHASGNYAINLERLIVGQVYRFQFLTKTGYTYLYNNGTSSVTVYTGNSSFTLGSKKNANIQASSSAMASHTVSVVRMTATQMYIIWGY